MCPHAAAGYMPPASPPRWPVRKSLGSISGLNARRLQHLLPVTGEVDERLIDKIATGSEVELDVDSGRFKDLASGRTYYLQPLGDVTEIVQAGGIFEYARRKGMLGQGGGG